MIKVVKLAILFLGCRLAWIWFEQCGADLGLGETLPFCLECSGIATIVRLLLLVIALWIIFKLYQIPPDNTEVYENISSPVQMIRIHWHRIALLLVLLTYPLWIWWVDSNTNIPGPDAFWITNSSCNYTGFKGTMLWGIELLFAVWGLRILHRG